MASTLDQLISALESAPDYSFETLERVLTENQPSAEEICGLAEATFPYGRTMISLNDTFEVIIGCWPRNGWCDAHDHGDAIGIVHSYSGEIEHFEYKFNGNYLDLFEHSSIKTGESRRLEKGMIHALQNVSSDEPYVGLHIYVPPTKDVRVFDLHSGDIYHVTDDAAAIIPKDERWLRSVERNKFTYRNLVREQSEVA